MPFADRRDAGRRLVERLRAFRGPDILVLGMPPDGVVIADEIATALGVPHGVLMMHDAHAAVAGTSARPLRGRTVVLVRDAFHVDDVADVRAAVRAVYHGGALRVVVAAPVAEYRAVGRLADAADKIVCLSMPDVLGDIDQWYGHARTHGHADARQYAHDDAGSGTGGFRGMTARIFPRPITRVAPTRAQA
ncbi:MULTISPECIES: hypothetical protein [unclassified Nocardia]|uniref:hypothetical protein n=1 Tax=unclassified Nocardia TaxID=2637762 RepID=UPI0024A8B48A|nr:MULTISPECIES: hypothetical protein [unclassified Nocardia]